MTSSFIVGWGYIQGDLQIPISPTSNDPKVDIKRSKEFKVSLGSP